MCNQMHHPKSLKLNNRTFPIRVRKNFCESLRNFTKVNLIQITSKLMMTIMITRIMKMVSFITKRSSITLWKKKKIKLHTLRGSQKCSKIYSFGSSYQATHWSCERFLRRRLSELIFAAFFKSTWHNFWTFVHSIFQDCCLIF